MKIWSRVPDDMKWLNPCISCFPAPSHQLRRPAHERPKRLEIAQPRLVSPPVSEIQRKKESTRGSSFATRTSLTTRHGSSRRQISSPYGFRYADERMSMLQSTEMRIETSFQPLVLGTDGRELQQSPIFPSASASDLDLTSSPCPSGTPSPPPMAVTCDEGVVASRIHRRSVTSSSELDYLDRNQTVFLENLPNQMQNPTTPSHLRAKPESQAYDRVKSVMCEKLELERRLRDIEHSIETKSAYPGSSRPASKSSRLEDTYFEPQASIPLSPALTFTTMKSNRSSSYASRPDRGLPPPPLPLVLQTPQRPLRNKSISRVSSWLSISSQQRKSTVNHRMSMESVTNMPRPVTSRDGFYQCVEPVCTSSDSITTTGSNSEVEYRSNPTLTFTSIASSAHNSRKGGSPLFEVSEEGYESSLDLSRVLTFGESQKTLPEEGSGVGMAF